MQVAMLGPEGTYSHAAAADRWSGLEPVFCDSIGDVVRADADRRLVPIENSLGGGVAETIDLLRDHRPAIADDVVHPIHHTVAARQQLSNIRRIRSHPQALDQCRSVIEEHGWATVTASSTAQAAQEIDSGEAAICSRMAAECNGLELLIEAAQDDRSRTRFLVLGGEPVRDRTALIIEPDEDRPGMLHELLGAFADRTINLTQIRSRPTRRRLGEYFFYVEAAAPGDADRLRAAVEDCRRLADVGVLDRRWQD